MNQPIDLNSLLVRESEQVEWKENVADPDDVVETLAAFANDLANLGGGYVVCGAREGKDADGFQRVTLPGLTADRMKEIEGRVLAACRDFVSPPITPQVHELPAQESSRRILVFVQPATARAHSYRRKTDTGKHYVRVGRETREARNGLLRDLLVRKGDLQPWDRRRCSGTTVGDIDLLALRDALQRMGFYTSDRGVEPFLDDGVQLSPFVPSLCEREPLTGKVQPRNYAILLFGREVQKFIPGAFSIFSTYPGTERSQPHAERHEIAGTVLDQARRLNELLDFQSYTAFDKNDPVTPNALKYPRRALQEALSNALAHRDYEMVDPTRVTVFSDRIELTSPGSLPSGVDVSEFQQGRSGAKWRNQSLAWFFSRLQLAQAEGQGIPTILKSMRDEGCPEPRFSVNEARLVCLLPAHPRHALLGDLREAERALALGESQRALQIVQAILDRDRSNARAIRLLAEVQRVKRDPTPLFVHLVALGPLAETLPPPILVEVAEALLIPDAATDHVAMARRLLYVAGRAHMEEREARRLAVAMLRAREYVGALDFVTRQMDAAPDRRRSPSLLQLRGDALLGLAKLCRTTGHDRSLPTMTRERAWRDMRTYLDDAEVALREAEALCGDEGLGNVIRENLIYASKLRGGLRPPRPS